MMMFKMSLGGARSQQSVGTVARKRVVESEALHHMHYRGENEAICKPRAMIEYVANGKFHLRDVQSIKAAPSSIAFR